MSKRDAPVTPTPSGNLSRSLQRGSWGIADQALISSTNFVTMVVLARGLGLVDFGIFAMVYGGLLFANSLQSALVVQPHGVLSTARTRETYPDYTLTTAATQLVFALGAALVAGGGALLAHLAGWAWAEVVLALAVCIVPWQLQEFGRRILYHEGRFSAAFVTDFISYGGQVAAVGVLWRAGMLTGPATFYAIGATSAIAACVVAWQLRHSLAGRLDRSVVGENWSYGKWLAGGELGYWLSSQVYMYLAGGMLGPSAAGILKAAHTIFGPMRVLDSFLRGTLPNRFARRLASEGTAGLGRQVRRAYMSAGPLLGGYCLLVALFAEPLPAYLFGAGYGGQGMVLVLYAVYAFVSFTGAVRACALKAGRLTQHIFIGRMVASALAVSLGWLFIRVGGTEGAVVGMITTSVIMNLVNWRAYHRHLMGPGRHPHTVVEPARRICSAASPPPGSLVEPLPQGG